MKKGLAKTSICVLLVVLLSSLGVFAGGQREASAASAEKLQPFKAAVDVQTAHSAPFIVAQAKGFLEKYGLKADYTNYPHGIAAIEALPSGTWDFLTTAFPGWTPGSLRYNLKIVAVGLWEKFNIGFFARPDSPIVKAGKGNIPGYPELYGTPELWKGKNILMPTGTTLHLTLSAALRALGLTADDVKITNIEVPSAYTAFKAGNGDLAGSWTNFSLENWKDGNVMVAHQDSVGVKIPGLFTASETVVKNNPELVAKAIRLYFETWNYIVENKDESAQIFLDYHIDSGYKMDLQTAKNIFDSATAVVYEDQLAMFQTGEFQKIGKETYDFFVSIGRYQAADWDRVVVKNFNHSFLQSIVQAKK